MIQLNSNLSIIDNSGAKIARCIKVLGKNSEASIGDVIVVSIRKATPHKRIKAGEVHKAVIVYTKKNTKRSNGSYMKLGINAAVILKDKGLLKPVLNIFHEIMYLIRIHEPMYHTYKAKIL